MRIKRSFIFLLVALAVFPLFGFPDAAPGQSSSVEKETISIDLTSTPKVRSVDFSPDGRSAVSASSDRALRLWDLRSGKLIRTFKGHAGSGRSARFSPDGRFILASNKDALMYVLTLWNARTGEKVREFKATMGVINSVCFSPDGEWALSGGEDNIVKLWEVNSGRKIRLFKGHWGDVNSVSFSPDGALALSGASDYNLGLWDVKSGKKIRTFRGHSDWVRSVCFSPDGRFAASGGDDHSVRLWDVISGKEIRAFTGHERDVNTVSLHPGGEWVLSGSDDRTVKLWEVKTGRLLGTFNGHSANVNSALFSPNGKCILSGGSDGVVRLWSTASGEEIIQMVAFSDGEWAALASNGYFTASAHGETRLLSSRGAAAPGAPRNMDRFNRPDLVAAQLSDAGPAAGGARLPETTSAPAGEPRLPPILSIESIRLSTHALEAGRAGRLFVTLKNTGPGDARDVYLTLSGKPDKITFPARASAPLIRKRGGRCALEIPIAGKPDLRTGRAYMDIRVVEPHFKVEIKGRRVHFDTRKARAPMLILSEFAASEKESSHPDGGIDLNEIVDVECTVLNIGDGEARDVSISVENSRKGVIPLGVVDGDRVTGAAPRFDAIAPGEGETVVYRFFINSDFSDPALAFLVKATEKEGSYGFARLKEAPIGAGPKSGAGPKAEARVQPADAPPPPPDGKVMIEDIPGSAEIETDLPKTNMKNGDGIALVIGNGNYEKLGDVDYAINDAVVMKKYLIEVLGFKDGNIFFVKDASKGDLELYLGSAASHRGKLYNAVKAGKSDLFVFYSGHGAPGLTDGKGYLAPVEASPDYIEVQGYSLEMFQKNLGGIPAKSITVVMDACFSGRGLSNGRSGSVEIDRSAPIPRQGVVMASSKNNQASTWYDEKQHGLFTYFFLKAIHNRNADFNQDGRLTFDEIHQYVSDKTEGVPYYARRLHGVDQTPTIEGRYHGKALVIY